MHPEMDENEIVLKEYMSELSEEAYEATWMMHLEYALWYCVLNGPKKYGRLDITEEQINQLKKLSDLCGGWVVWDISRDPEFVNIDNWHKIYNANIEKLLKEGQLN